MFGKTPVTALQEYCAKNTEQKPIYEFAAAADGTKSFICCVYALNEMAEGMGRSKKDAKHDAASHIIKKLKVTHPEIEDIPQTEYESCPMSDTVAELRDLCLQLNHPFPSFEIVQQAGPPEAPEFTMECRISSIRRYATANTKKAARQLVAKQLIDIIQSLPVENSENQIMAIDQQVQLNEEETRKKFKSYREFIESDIKEEPGTLFSDRHNYFAKMDDSLKKAAFRVIRDDNIYSEKEKIDLVLKALKIKYKATEMPARTGGILFFIELINCDFDFAFAGKQDDIYNDMLVFFNEMLQFA